MDGVKVEDQVDVKPKPKLHLWNKILEDDELSEKLAASMSKLGDEYARRFIRKRGKRNKKKKKNKDKKDLNSNNSNTNGNNQPNGTNLTVKTTPSASKPDVKCSNGGQPKTQQAKFLQPKPPIKPQQSKPNNLKNNNNRPGQLSRRKSKLPNSVLQAEAKKISKKLGEKRLDLIIRTINNLGLEEALKLCSEVLTIEEAGGLMTLNGVRRRTPGGVFFHLIRSNGRYDASIVSKIFKEGDNKEPVFKSRNKCRNNLPTSNKGLGTKGISPNLAGQVNCPLTTPVQPVATTTVVQPILRSTSVPQLPLETPITPISQSPGQTILQKPSIISIQPESTQSNEQMEIVQSDFDNRMDDDDEDDNLVIVEYDPTALANTNQNTETIIKCTFTKASPDLNILSQQSPSTSETPSTINSNVAMFTTNRISVDA